MSDFPAEPLVAQAAIVGGGPAGLMAAEVLARAGVQVDVFDAMRSVGRKFLLAGKGGLNLTHSEPMAQFAARFGARRAVMEPLLHAFPPAAVRDWAQGLEIGTFVGSSGRVFPADMKAAPLLRAWLHRLRTMGVRFHMRQRCTGVAAGDDGRLTLQFISPAGPVQARADAVVLALGGASWPQLGGDGAWASWLPGLGADVAPLQASNCGFDVARAGAGATLLPGWSEHMSSRFAGHALKTVALSVASADGSQVQQRGEFVITHGGVEGSLIYAASAVLRST
ncbi:MAG: TIGR03862 family flavoprotein, partial [Burkholderiaceae bacterium]